MTVPARKRSAAESDEARPAAPWEVAARYHQQTKHHFHRYARSLGYLDWSTQPDPFRRFKGAPMIRLALSGGEKGPCYDDLFRPGAVLPRPVDFHSISAFFELSLALSAWKEYRGSRWALRINPSSGNLHPTEGYLVIGPVEGLSREPAVYHYAPAVHALQQRTTITIRTWRALLAGFPPACRQARPETFLAGLSSILWREAWKYGERAWRYCQHDAGHALAALAVSAAVQGWHAVPLDAINDADLCALLGLDRPPAGRHGDGDFGRAEREEPELLLAVVPETERDRLAYPRRLPRHALSRVAAGRWHGVANRLSGSHVRWEVIEEVTAACRKETSEPAAEWDPQESAAAPLCVNRMAVPAARIIRQRRSAVELDGHTSIEAGLFFCMMDRVLPRPNVTPWSALGPPACVSLGLFVHLVKGISPGLYCLVRSPRHRQSLQRAMRSSFLWKAPPGCPPTLPLYLLLEGDCRRLAARASCHQAIAGLGAFSLGMIAEFQRPLQTFGAWFYRRLFWETGVIGQVLYLEAEAAGIRGTGIGCYFDDPVHEVFGLTGTAFQSLYHFTVGGPVEDPRLRTDPPYASLGAAETGS